MHAHTSLRLLVFTSFAAALASAAGDAFAPCDAADAGDFPATFSSGVSGIGPWERKCQGKVTIRAKRIRNATANRHAKDATPDRIPTARNTRSASARISSGESFSAGIM